MASRTSEERRKRRARRAALGTPRPPEPGARRHALPRPGPFDGAAAPLPPGPDDDLPGADPFAPGAKPFDPLDLPIHQHADAILAAVRDHRVCVVQGPTGSGKTTQLPRILLRSGLIEGRIGITQPRRIAAVSVAHRLAEELRMPLGGEVGYAIRFDDRTGPDTRVKVMTDGILLQEVRHDGDFSAYELLIVDEAHERSLNIDFVLGLLHRALARRRDLKVIVSSATLDPETFQRFFSDIEPHVPLVEVAARTFPVEVVHRDAPGRAPGEVAEAVAQEIAGIHREGGPGHVLAFLSGEGMIHDTERRLQEFLGRRSDLRVVPLYGRLTREEQERVFAPTPGQRKVVLATNIAETSITIPDVRHVVDSGLAKIPRLSGPGIVSLREEGISRASAKQRAGRAGRTAPGRCVRLYGRREFERRPEFTDEEILRLDLTDVALRLIDLGVHDVERFPFPTEPPRRRLRAALGALEAMGAITRDRRLTSIGQRMVAFPLGPRLARMVVAAHDEAPDVLDEVLQLGAFMSTRPPYIVPPGEEHIARGARERFEHPEGDVLTALAVMAGYRQALNTGRHASFCERHFLDPHTMAFITKVHDQLASIATDAGMQVRGGGKPTGVIRAVARAFADQILLSRGRKYESKTHDDIRIHPSSVLFHDGPRFAVACEIVETKRTWARVVTGLTPEQVAEANPELAERWGLRRPSRKARKEREQRERLEIPARMYVGDVPLEVALKKGQPHVDVPLQRVADLAGMSPDWAALPRGAHGWRARVHDPDSRIRFQEGTPLGTLLKLLPHLPLPDDPASLPKGGAAPQGVLLEADRNLHALEQGLGELLAPRRPLRGRKPGWIMLVSNGAGGFFYEVGTDFSDALFQTLDAVGDLREALGPGDDLEEDLERLERGLTEQAEAVTAVLAAGPR